MIKDKFINWLISEHHIKNPNKHLYIISKIEKYYGDIDEHYSQDSCAYLLSEFEYSTQDKNNKKKPIHKIPITPISRDIYSSYYALTGDYRNILKRKYMKFLRTLK